MARANKTPLILILAIALLTPLASTALFYLWPPSGATHHGEVLNAPALLPPREWRLHNGEKINAEQWRGKWALLHTTTTSHCNEQCRRRLCQMRQLRLMLPGNYFRVRRAWLISGDESISPPSGRWLGGGEPIKAKSDCGEARASERDSSEVDILQGVEVLRGDIKTLPAPAGNYTREDYIYLADPAGRLAMRFNPQLSVYEIRKDVSRLLKLSKGWKRAQ